jgi:hypothetical protein
MSETMTPQERCNAEDQYGGGCSECGHTDGYLNIGNDHIGHCKKHKTCWPIDANLFGSCMDETEEEQRQAASFMFDFKRDGELRPVRDGELRPGWRVVEPLIPDLWKVC